MRSELKPDDSSGNYFFAKAFGAIATASGLGAAIFEVAGNEQLSETLVDAATFSVPAAIFGIAYGLATRD